LNYQSLVSIIGGLNLFILFYLFCLALAKVILTIGTRVFRGFRVVTNPKVNASPKIVQSQGMVIVGSNVIIDSKPCYLKEFSGGKSYLALARERPP
jgi:hypothetical protein